MMTPQELEIVEKLADAFNLFCELPEQHPMAKSEFCTRIHDLQNAVMSRDAVRNHPEIFTNKADK